MRLVSEKIFAIQVLALLFCLLLGLSVGSVRAVAAELGFTRDGGRMVFTIPYENAPEVNALFFDSGAQVSLILPVAGLKVAEQNQPLDDEWITAFGVEKVGQELRWYLKKRDPALKVKSFLALKRQDSGLQVVLLKPYRTWQPVVGSEKSPSLQQFVAPSVAEEQGKMARLNQLLEKNGSTAAGKLPASGPAASVETSSPSLMKSAVRSFFVLIFLVLVIVGLSFWFKRYRKKGGSWRGSKLVKVLSVEVVSGKHQVMLLELLGEVLVVGICGERMTLLKTISDSERVEELRLLQESPESGTGNRRFAGYLQGFIEKDLSVTKAKPNDVQAGENVSGGVTYEPRPAVNRSQGVSAQTHKDVDELPENYREVVSQIKNRLKKGDRG